ncbi:PPM-type phosphatase-like domain [Dillenia turbinata]|uniref:protein-serine/threonine phosphatase n=1 Tax=Dillenia turbinata TaxID=194707 RepID=A0AAN8VY08_9MAGN
MFSWIRTVVTACWRPVQRYVRMNKDDVSMGRADDALLWYRDLEKHSCGEYSFAVVQANEVMEDQSQVETGRDSIFVGVYDGHGGPEASRFICDHLFQHLMRLARDNGTISEDVLRSAFSTTEDGFLTLVRRTCAIKPTIAAIGSCCLVGVIWKGTLYVAHVGDSRAVLGTVGRSNNIIAEQLTRDHNASMEEVRQELRASHPDDSHIVVLKQGIWRIKGIIQVSRSIGDAYLKKPEFSVGSSMPRFHIPEPLRRPVLTAEPSICTRVLQPNDRFLIFASDGLWEHMSIQEAVEIVHNYPRPGIARRLLTVALHVASRKREVTYDQVTKFEKGVRRYFHDDISVVVIFIDHELLEGKAVPELSVRSFMDTVGPSNFTILEGMDPKAMSDV